MAVCHYESPASLVLGHVGSDNVHWSDAVHWPDAVHWSGAVHWSDTVYWSDAVYLSVVVWSSVLPVTRTWCYTTMRYCMMSRRYS